MVIAAMPSLPYTPPIAVMSCHEPRPACCERLEFDDGSVRIRGDLPADERESLELTHYLTGRVIDGFDVWWPKEADDDA